MIPLVYPEFASILSIVGCVCSVTLGYIIPYVIYRGRFYSKIGRTETIINLSVMAMGLIGGLMGLL
jgi:amino acid permease